MTVTGYAPDNLAPGRPDGSGTGIPARRTAFDDLADQAARLPWCWPALLTLAFGFYQVGRPELWRDELASWSFASRPVPDLIAAARHTGATQLAYYLVLHVWMAAFGDSADAMRAPSVLAMAGAAACVALIGRRLAGNRAGLLAGLAFALAPSVSRFAQEARFYAFAVLVATLATLLLLRALDRPSAPRWLAYTASLALLGYVDVVALSVLAGHVAGAVLHSWHRRDRRLLWFLPAGSGGYYLDYASGAAFVARQARAGDGIVYQATENQDSWLMVGYGLQYYLARDMPNGVPVPRELFIARTAAEAATLYPEPCQHPAACLGAEPRIWVIGVGRQTSPYQAVTPAQAAVLKPRYRLTLVKHQRSLTMFLLAPTP